MGARRSCSQCIHFWVEKLFMVPFDKEKNVQQQVKYT